MHIEGEPYERGYQHGHLMAHEIETYLERCASQLDPDSLKESWQWGRTTSNALFLRGFDEEILQEMRGIADGPPTPEPSGTAARSISPIL